MRGAKGRDSGNPLGIPDRKGGVSIDSMASSLGNDGLRREDVFP
jgi:hypothetical protein